MDKYIPINKGNYEMDTEARLERFEANRALGWEKVYDEYRRNWIEYPQKQIVSEYPLLVDLELSTVCNLRCPMCYTISEDFKEKVSIQFMSMDLFKKIINEIGGKVPAVRLSLRGETTLNPNLVECIRYCKMMGIGEVSFLTNGSRLSEENFIAIAEAGADWITVSIDGIGEQYERIRKPLKFDETLEKIEKIYEIKKRNGWNKPVIKIQGIWPAIRDNPSKYYNTFAPYVDLVAFNPLIDFADKGMSAVYERNFMCPQLYQRLVIGVDGKVMLCANDEDGQFIIGDVNINSVYDVWHGDEMEKVRKLHGNGDYKVINVCRQCYLPRTTEESEHALVNGREIVIRNYVKAVQ